MQDWLVEKFVLTAANTVLEYAPVFIDPWRRVGTLRVLLLLPKVGVCLTLYFGALVAGHTLGCQVEMGSQVAGEACLVVGSSPAVDTTAAVDMSASLNTK